MSTETKPPSAGAIRRARNFLGITTDLKLYGPEANDRAVLLRLARAIDAETRCAELEAALRAKPFTQAQLYVMWAGLQYALEVSETTPEGDAPIDPRDYALAQRALDRISDAKD